MALTNLEIKRAQPKEKAYSLSDGLGLALLIEPNGSKGWRFRYRFDNKARLMSFGSYPLVSLSEAREMRDKSRKLVISGVDPMAERRTQKALREQAKAMTFEVVSREWHRSKADRWTLGYRDEIIKTFEQDVFPFIGQRPMGDITPQELLQVLKRIEQRGALEKTRKYASAVVKFFVMPLSRVVPNTIQPRILRWHWLHRKNKTMPGCPRTRCLILSAIWKGTPGALLPETQQNL